MRRSSLVLPMSVTWFGKRLRRLSCFGASFLLGAASLIANPADEEFFESKIRPLLIEHCYECHSAEYGKAKGGLRLDSREGWLKGGEGGPVITPGDPDHSRLIQAVRYHDKELRMPPEEPLRREQIESLVTWVKRGAPDPRAGGVSPLANTPKADGETLSAARRQWAYQAPQDPPVPVVKERADAKTALDQFILAKLEERGLRKAAPADKRTLIRRATFGLTGLPPRPEDIQAFLDDTSEDAFEKVVDRLLDSPRYGEHFGRYWLDLVRYADSVDQRQIGAPADISEAWRYRDWVVRAFNRDLPYDQFILQQFAGDLLMDSGDERFDPDGIIATTLLAIGRWEQGEADKEKMMTDIVDDQVDLTGRTFLGLTLACARCHDHKFDPITAEDYYALAGIFYSSHVIPEVGSKAGDTQRLKIPLLSTAELKRREQREQRMVELRNEIERRTDLEVLAAAGEVIHNLAHYFERMAEYRRENRGVSPETAKEKGLTHPVILRRWIEYFTPDAGQPLAKFHENAGGQAGVFIGRNALHEDTPSVTANSNEKDVSLQGIRLPARRVTLHPSPREGVAAVWKSPLHGSVRITGRVSDANAGCGDGVDWILRRRTQDSFSVLATGGIPNGASQKLEEGNGASLEAVQVSASDALQLIILPKANHGCDSTVVELEITERSSGQKWLLTSDAVSAGSGPIPPAAEDRAKEWAFAFFNLASVNAVDGDLFQDSLLGEWRQAMAQDEGEKTRRISREMQEQLTVAHEQRTRDRQSRIDALVEELRTATDEEIPEVSRRLFASPAPLTADPGLNKLYRELVAPRGSFWRPIRDEWKRQSLNEELSARIRELNDLEQHPPPPPPFAHGIREGGVPQSMFAGIQDAHLQIRGRYDRLGPVVRRGFPKLLTGEDAVELGQGSGRLELARWIASRSNPLTARVWVNRIWQFHFGEGLVRTPSNYGKLGQPPTHPELLDYLTHRFLDSNWSIKALHRLILLSGTYQQSSTSDPETLAQDPDNNLWGRMNRIRLTAEELRDSLLAVNGTLDSSPGGPPFRNLNTPRRTLYLMTVRSESTNFRILFDAADPTAIVDQRISSTVAPQALFLLNNEFILQQSSVLAQAVCRTHPDLPSRVQWLYQTLYGRPPSPKEREIAAAALTGLAPDSDAARDPLWERYCQVLLCANEFVYVD